MENVQRQRLHQAIVRLAEGDRSVFPPLFEELWPMILGFVRRTVGPSPDAEDVAQQVLINLFFRISEFDRTRDGVAWVFGIAAHEIRTYQRKLQRRREVSGSGRGFERPSAAASQEESCHEATLDAALEAALGQLSNDDRSALLRSHVPQDTVPAATWRKRRQRALQRLREAWRQLYD